MKKYVFTIKQNTESNEETVPVIAKNIQSAIAKLCHGDFYSESQITNISIVK